MGFEKSPNRLFMKKNKICFVVPDITWIGGIERVVCVLSNKLYERGYNVRIVSLTKNKDEIQYYLDENIDVIYLNPSVRNIDSGGIKRVVFHFGLLIKSFYKFKPIKDEILVFNSFPGSLFGVLSSFFKPNIKIAVEHANYYHYKGLSKIFRNLIYKKCNKLITITNDDFLAFKKNKFNCKHINNPKSFESKNKASCHQKVICSVGRLEDQKSFSSLIKAFYLSTIDNADLNDWKLKIYGEGSLRNELQNIIHKYDLVERVLLEGYKKDIQQYMIESSMFVLSSKYEGFGLVLLEAMECGLPIVSFDCKYGPSEILGNGKYGVLVENQNIDALSVELTRFMLDPVLLNIYRKKSIERSSYYSIDVVVDEWISLFSELTLKYEK